MFRSFFFFLLQSWESFFLNNMFFHVKKFSVVTRVCVENCFYLRPIAQTVSNLTARVRGAT